MHTQMGAATVINLRVNVIRNAAVVHDMYRLSRQSSLPSYQPSRKDQIDQFLEPFPRCRPADSAGLERLR